MRLLLDTHALIWLITDDAKLGKPVRDAILDPANDVFVSVVSFWEMAIKMRAGKLGGAPLQAIMEAVATHGIAELPLSRSHILELLALPIHEDHRDPFDHQLVAQAIAEDLIFVTNDRRAGRYAIRRMACADV